jgi:hypothetical protein
MMAHASPKSMTKSEREDLQRLEAASPGQGSSRREVYRRVAPRQTQGNAWNTIVAMASALDGAKAST